MLSGCAAAGSSDCASCEGIRSALGCSWWEMQQKCKLWLSAWQAAGHFLNDRCVMCVVLPHTDY